MDYEIKERFYLYQIQHCQSPLLRKRKRNPRVTHPTMFQDTHSFDFFTIMNVALYQ